MKDFSENIVIVLNLDQYIEKYREEVPFKARVIDIHDNMVDVISLVTGEEYDVGIDQLIEGLEITEIRKILKAAANDK